MSRRGPAPTPTAILELRGSRRAEGRAGEPRPPVKAPTCPARLKGEAKKEWVRVVKQLKAMAVLAEIDRALLAAYCEAWAELDAIERKMASQPEGGLLISTSNGNIIQSPLVGIRNRAVERLGRLAQQFGMSPAARTRLATGEAPAEEDDFTKWKRGADAEAS